MDFLVREDVPSNLGDYSYQVWDAKLSKSIKPEHILQLCCYAEMLSDISGVRPEKGYVITGDQSKEEVLFDNYFSFYKLVKNQFLAIQESKLSKPPNPGDYTNWGLFAEHAKLVLSLDNISIMKQDVSKLSLPSTPTTVIFKNFSNKKISNLS